MICNGKPLFIAMVRKIFHSCFLAWSVFGIININLHILADLPCQEKSLAPAKRDAGQATGPVWTLWRREQALDPGLPSPQPCHYTSYAILALQDTDTSTKFMHEYGNKDAHYFQVSVWATCMHIDFIIALKFTVYISLASKVYTLWYSSNLFILNIPFKSFIKHSAS
jgi:hypothetical protein